MWICGLKQQGSYQVLKKQIKEELPDAKILSTHTEYMHEILDIEDEGTGIEYRGVSILYPILCMEYEDANILLS